MALQQQFTASQSPSGTTIYLDDDTGEYSVDNPGGYETPNDSRSDLALILIATYKKSTGDIDLPYSSVDPEDVTQWTIPDIDFDGHIEFQVFSVAKKTGAETPATNDFVYDFSGNQLQRWNGSVWVSAENTELQDNDAAHSTVDYPALSLMFRAFNNVNKLYISGCKTASKTDIKEMISEVSAMINGTLALFAESAFSDAESNIEKYQSRVDQLIALV